MSFESLGLSAAVLRGVAERGYEKPTPIQSQVIPVVLEGRDVMAGAQTGTGKTAGFALPVLHRLSAATAVNGRRRVRALILTPTRELAAQIAESVRAYGRHLPLRSAVIFGGVSARSQTAELERGVDIVVATPGRLLDHARQRAIDLSSVETFVVDEADRMLDMGFLPDVRRVMALLPARRQNLLFSATFPNDIRKLAAKLLRSPAEIEVSRRNAAPDKIEQIVHLVDKAQKRTVLASLIRSRDLRQVLVFARTKRGADRLARQLGQDGLKAAAIHGNKSQGARTRALADFKQGTLHVLVATDIAARGLDIDELPLVVNFELPDVAEYYVHRIGRTGRAGREGLAVSLVCNDERPQLAAIERLIGAPILQQHAQGCAVDARLREPSPAAQREPRGGGSGRAAESSPAGKRDRTGPRGKHPPGRSRATRRRAAAALRG